MAVPAEQQGRQALSQLSDNQKRGGDLLENHVDKRQAARAPAAQGDENAAPMPAPPSPANVGGEGGERMPGAQPRGGERAEGDAGQRHRVVRPPQRPN